MNTLGRISSGIDLFRNASVVERHPVLKEYFVHGNSGNYVVQKDGEGSWTCTCPDFEHRGGKCKHIWACIIKEEDDGGI